jgi:methionyl aminopeptidase
MLSSGGEKYLIKRVGKEKMAVMLKSRQEVALLRAAGRIVAETYEVLRPHVVVGTTTAELDHIAEDYVRSKGAIPVYKGYGARPARNGQPETPPFPSTICVAINEVICHGIPSDEQHLRAGDIIGIDIGVRYNGWVGDSCRTFAVGEVDDASRRLLQVAERCMELGIEQARAAHHMGDIGAAIQAYAEAHGCSTVRELVGHGVGRSIHEDPQVPHYGQPGTGMRLRPGMVFSVEPMINAGRPEIRLLPDRWTIRTADGSRSAQFEHTIAITDGAPELLTLP